MKKKMKFKPAKNSAKPSKPPQKQSAPPAAPAADRFALPPESGYLFVRAIVDGPCLRWEYQTTDSPVQGRNSHDEDVADFSERDIRTLMCQVLDLDEQYADRIEVVYR